MAEKSKLYQLNRDATRCDDHSCESRSRCLRYRAIDIPRVDVWHASSLREVPGEECSCFISTERAKR